MSWDASIERMGKNTIFESHGDGKKSEDAVSAVGFTVFRSPRSRENDGQIDWNLFKHGLEIL